MPTQELLVKNLKVSFATPAKELVAVVESAINSTREKRSRWLENPVAVKP